MKNKYRVPYVIYGDEGSRWEFICVDEQDPRLLRYWSDYYGAGLSLSPGVIEKEFRVKYRRKPKTKIVVQDKWSCAASALAMITGEHIFFVKQAMGKAGWRNDEYGSSNAVLIEAARLLGKDLIHVPRSEFSHDMGPAIITVPSLNYKGRAHAVAWNGKEILDPNYGRPGRKYYGVEWAPWTVNALSALVLLDKRLPDHERQEIDKLTRKRDRDNIKIVRAAIFKQLKESNGLP